MPRARVGVALLLPPSVAGEVDGLRRAVGDGALGRIPAHLTHVPPVNVREDRLDDALALLRGAAAQTRPFVLTLGPPATFLPAAPVLYLGVGGEVEAVHSLRDRVFEEPLARPLTWPFVPHVTLADEAPAPLIEAAVGVLGRYEVEAVFQRVHLLREGRGRRWEPVADFAFAAPAVVGRGGLPLELSVSDHLDPGAAAFWDQEWAVVSRDHYGEGWQPARPFAVTARREGRVVGVATGHSRGCHAHLAELVVAADARGQGIGTQLLAAAESLAAGRGCLAMTVHTWPRGPAHRFYLGRGWVEDGALPPWPGRDRLVQLRRDL